MNKHKTREEWLEAAVIQMTPLFEKGGYKIPALRVACGWPSSRGLSSKKRCIGECWDSKASQDNVHQIFISPWLEPGTNEGVGVVPTLIHEVVHAVVGIKEKHGKVFGKCARAVGLEGKLTATVASAELLKQIEGWLIELGDYPHSKLDPLKSPKKTQSTRMIKMECKIDECGYVARTSRKWLEEAGPCWCPLHQSPMDFELPTEDEGESED